MLSIKALPPLFKIASAQFFPKFLKESKVQLFLIVCFSFPSKENKTPSKSILSYENVAKAPIGAVQPPSSVFKNSRSICVQISVSE
mgnify:CR=1 FL=1